MWINSANKITLGSPSAWFEDSGNLDTPLLAALYVKNGETDQELFKLSFYVTIASYDPQTDPINALDAQCNGVTITRPNDLSSMEVMYGSEERDKQDLPVL